MLLSLIISLLIKEAAKPHLGRKQMIYKLLKQPPPQHKQTAGATPTQAHAPQHHSTCQTRGQQKVGPFNLPDGSAAKSGTIQLARRERSKKLDHSTSQTRAQQKVGPFNLPDASAAKSGTIQLARRERSKKLDHSTCEPA